MYLCWLILELEIIGEMRNRVIGICLTLLAGFLLGGCSASEQAQDTAPPEPEKPPEVYQVKFETTKGEFTIQVNREWAPRGADHFYELVQTKFYDEARFFRAVRGFVIQFGISGNPEIQRLWGQMMIPDDPVKQSNKKGFITYAKMGPNSRTTQVFINLRDNSSLDKDGFAPFGQVVEGMDVVERFWISYGEVFPRGSGPDPTRIELEGNAYLDQKFPRLDSIIRATIQEVPRNRRLPRRNSIPRVHFGTNEAAHLHAGFLGGPGVRS